MKYKNPVKQTDHVKRENITQVIEKVFTREVKCFGDDEWSGHPTVFYNIDETNEVFCGYCDKKFIYVGEDA
jgi:uncharacterized Zn-finger protein